jgi:hypothetical protein
MSIVVSSPGLSEEDVKIALGAVERLREEEKKFIRGNGQNETVLLPRLPTNNH